MVDALLAANMAAVRRAAAKAYTPKHYQTYTMDEFFCEALVGATRGISAWVLHEHPKSPDCRSVTTYIYRGVDYYTGSSIPHYNGPIRRPRRATIRYKVGNIYHDPGDPGVRFDAPDRGPAPDEGENRRDAIRLGREIFERAKQVDERMALVIWRHYGLGETMTEIARDIGVSKELVSRIIRRAGEWLRKEFAHFADSLG